ncbi:MAG: hypothetical protein ACR2QC_07985 [Gammaproteobacteria bacterium]
MATLTELYDLANNNQGLLPKVVSAGVIKSESILGEVTPGANRLQWAIDTLDKPGSRGNCLLNYILAANSSATVQQIVDALDPSIQANVDAAIDAIVPSGA